MHLHRGFGDAAIVGNLFAQAAARHLNGNWWKWTTLCGPLRVLRKCMNPFWMPAMNYTSEVESNASTASLLRQSRQPCWAASRADRGGPDYLNRISALIGGASARVKLPSGRAAA